METEYTTPEQELVKKAKENDPEAQTLLYQRYYPLLLRYGRLRGLSWHDSEDVTAITLSKALMKIDTFTSKANFKSWVYGIYRRELAEYKRSKKITFVPLESIPEEKHPSSTDIPESIACYNETVTKAFSQLTDEQKTALQMLAAGTDQVTIAQITKNKEAATRRLIHNARQNAKKSLLSEPEKQPEPTLVPIIEEEEIRDVIMLARRGSLIAVDQLAQKFKPLVKDIGTRAGLADPDLLEDLCKSVISRTFIQPQSYTNKKDYSHEVTKVARRQALVYLRSA